MYFRLKDLEDWSSCLFAGRTKRPKSTVAAGVGVEQDPLATGVFLFSLLSSSFAASQAVRTLPERRSLTLGGVTSAACGGTSISGTFSGVRGSGLHTVEAETGLAKVVVAQACWDVSVNWPALPVEAARWPVDCEVGSLVLCRTSENLGIHVTRPSAPAEWEDLPWRGSINGLDVCIKRTGAGGDTSREPAPLPPLSIARQTS